MWSAEHRAAEQRAKTVPDGETTQRLFGRIAWRLLLAGLVCWWLWRLLGLVGVVVSAPLFGVLLARPLLDLVSASRAAVKQHVLADLEGRHFEYHGVALDIAEDEDHRRWIRVHDLRKLLPGLPRDEGLRRQFGDDCREDPDVPAAKALRVEARALLGSLARATDPSTLRLKVWLEREVVAPADKLRQRTMSGRRPSPPTL